MTVTQAIDSFLLDCQARNLRPASLKTYARQLHSFGEFAATADVATVDRIGAQLVRGYLAAELGRGLSPNSVRTTARCLRVFLNFIVTEGVLSDSPMRTLRMPRGETRRPDVFTVDEVRRLIVAARSKRDQAVILTLLDTGCRLSEIVSLRIADVDLHAGVVHVNRTKARRQRTVFVGKTTRTAIEAYLSETPATAADPLWRVQKGTGLTIDGMKRLLARVGHRAGVSPCAAHKYRRTFATWTLRSGMDVYSVRDMMGHSAIAMLAAYVAMSDEDLAAAHVAHGPVDHMQALIMGADMEALSE